MGYNCPSRGTGGCARAVWEGPGEQALAISKNKSPHSDLQPERMKGTPPPKWIQMPPANTEAGFSSAESERLRAASLDRGFLLFLRAADHRGCSSALWEGNYLPRSSLNKTRTLANLFLLLRIYHLATNLETEAVLEIWKHAGLHQGILILQYLCMCQLLICKSSIWLWYQIMDKRCNIIYLNLKKKKLN